MDFTQSENRQPGVINGTPTVKPAFQSSSGREKRRKGKMRRKALGFKLLREMFLMACIGTKVDTPVEKQQGSEKQGTLKPKAGSKQER